MQIDTFLFAKMPELKKLQIRKYLIIQYVRDGPQKKKRLTQKKNAETEILNQYGQNDNNDSINQINIIHKNTLNFININKKDQFLLYKTIKYKDFFLH